MNKVFLIGRLGKDPEIRYSPDGVAVTKFSLATSERTKQGEKTEWHNIVVFGNQAENCSKFINKGSLVCVEGKIQNRKYVDKNNVERMIKVEKT